MFCIRSWLPLLLIPINASPSFILLFFACTYFLNRPCVYCSFLLLILFLTSCNWSDRCLFDFNSNWFEPRFSSGTATSAASGCAACSDGVDCIGDDLSGSAIAAKLSMLNSTARALGGAAAKQLARVPEEWTGVGLEWLRSLLGRREWRIECLDVYVRL